MHIVVINNIIWCLLCFVKNIDTSNQEIIYPLKFLDLRFRKIKLIVLLTGI